MPNGTSSISSAINVSGSGAISDVNVSVNMPHAWVGDLTFTLNHDGTDVVLIDRPGIPGSTWGCSRDNIVATLDDGAAAAVESQCANATPTINGTYRPNGSLAAFNGASGNGAWTLTVADAYTSADAGTLNSWSVEICTGGAQSSSGIDLTVVPNLVSDRPLAKRVQQEVYVLIPPARQLIY